VERKLSCREQVYAGWQNAIEFLPKIGIKYMEVQARPDADIPAIARSAREKGVTVLTLATSVELDNDESVAAFKKALDAAQQIGVHHFFVSAKGADRPSCMGVLKQLAEEAKQREVTICLETHPPFCQNADDMLRTMADVNHPNVRVNFDTANIFYYNEGVNSADELPRVVEYVASVHLKDTDGGFKSNNFPVFGEGVVDFRRIFDTLDKAGFDGPLTIELEGPVMRGLDPEGRHAKVSQCVDYLRGIGVL